MNVRCTNLQIPEWIPVASVFNTNLDIVSNYRRNGVDDAPHDQHRQPDAPETARETAQDLTRVVVVVGASSGIGRATALDLAREGAHVVLIARREDELEDAARECEELGAASATVLTTDIGTDDDVRDAVAEVRERFGRIDAVVHCAGIVTYGRTEATDADDARGVVETNLLGSMTVARHVVPVFREQGRGTLVLVGSLLGQIAVPELTPYVVTKWGVRALARQLHIENLDLPGVRIVHLAPGSVDTPIYDRALDSAGTVNSPPPPVIAPERVARQIVRSLDGRRTRRQTSWVNYLLIGAFNLAPPVWDRLIGPVFDATSRRRGRGR